MSEETQIIKAEQQPGEVRRLPAATNDGSELVAKSIERLIAGVPAGVNRDEMAYNLVVACNESELSKCTAASTLIAAHNCARIGLMPGKVFGLAFFVPLEKRRGSGRFNTELWIGYPGYIELSVRNNYLASVESDCVFDGEEFRTWTDERGKHLLHEVNPNRDVYRDKITHAYCVAQLRSGGTNIEVCNRSQLDRSKRSGGPWKTDEFEMSRKTPIIRAAKRWPKTAEMAMAIHVEEQRDLGREAAAIEVSPRKHKTQTYGTLSAADPAVSDSDLDALKK